MGEVIDMGMEPWLSKAQIAEHLGVSTRTIERWHVRGLPYARVVGVNRYKRSLVETWISGLDDDWTDDGA